MDNKIKKLTDQEKQDELLEMQLRAAPKARIFDILAILTLLVIVFGFGVSMFILPDKEFSEQEQRMLAQFPEIGDENGRLGRLLNGSFTRNIAEYYADQLPLRDMLTGLKGIAEIGMLKRENNGVILAKNDFLVPRDTPPDYERLQNNINHAETFASAMSEIDVPVTLAMAPRTMDILRAAGGYLPAAYPTHYSVELWDFYEQSVNSLENIYSVNLLDAFEREFISKMPEYYYYRTDHHWTTQGAWIAYIDIIKQLSDNFDYETTLPENITAETASDEFYGTTWSKAGMPWVTPDALEYYRYNGDEEFLTTIVDTGVSFNGFYDRAYLDKKDKYGSFIGGVNTWVEITKPGEVRPKLLLIKDSFAHAVVPFLAYNYDLLIIDLRGFSITQSVARIVQNENIDQILILYNIANFMESYDLANLLNGLDIESEETVQDIEFDFEEGFTAREIIDRVMEAFYEDVNFPYDLEYLFSGNVDDNENYYKIDARDASLVLGGSREVLPAFDYIYDYAFALPDGYNAFEISVLRTSRNHTENLEDVRLLLEERRKMINAKNIPFYKADEAWIVDAYRIITADNYAVLLQTTDNDKAENIIRNMLTGEPLREAAVPEVTVPVQETTAENAANPPGITTAVITAAPNIPEVTASQLAPTAAPVTEPPVVIADNITRTPVLTVRKYSHNSSYVIGGTCENGAWIEVTGGLHTILTRSNHGDFLVEVPFDGSKRNINLTLATFVEGKEPSPPIEILVRPQTGITMYEDSGRFGVVVGYNYFTIFADSIPDFIGSNLISDRQITDIRISTENKIQELRSRGNNAEIIYLLVPNPSRIYPENMPSRYAEFKGDTLKRQWIQGVTAGGATVIDLLDTMVRHKNDEFKVFHYTDSHWTEYGAMLAYIDLMNHIGEKFPDASPRPASDFHVFNRRAYFGDIYKTLDLPKTALREYSAFVNFRFDSPCGKINLYDDIDSVCLVHDRISMAATTRTNVQGNFPNAYFIRDSFAGPIHAFLTDRFATAEWRRMWDYRFTANEIAGMGADYVIYIISERNIPEIMHN